MSVVSRILDRLTGRAPTPDSPHNGVIHSATGPNGYSLAFAEQSAIARALANIGYNNADPAALRDIVQRYTAAARTLAKENPAHPLIAHYAAKAKLLNVPDVVGDSGTGYTTVPTTGPIGEELGHAATPLVRFLNRLEHKHLGAPMLNVERAVITKPASEPAPIVKPPLVRPAPAPLPGPSIKPATSSTNRPIPLVDAPAVNRWRDLDQLHAQKADRNAMLSHLMNVHSTTRKQAADTIRRWARSKRI